MLATAGISSGIHSSLQGQSSATITPTPPIDNDAFKISVFSKNLQWLGYGEMAQVAAEIGFDGIDITVRPQGHVLPERVVEDLPKAVEVIRQAGLNVYMMTTAIKSADDPLTEDILKTASALGIKHYRMGWLTYDDKRSIEDNLTGFEGELTKLAQLNKKYSIYGEYQNHAGAYFGAPIWDLYGVLKKINSPWIGSQYDILHATVEGTNAWSIGFKLLSPYIKSIDIKDFQWAKKDGKWVAEIVPLGLGLVDYKSYVPLIKKYALNVPVSMHFEYALGGAENGATTLTVKREEVINAMKNDCNALRTLLRTAQLLK